MTDSSRRAARQAPWPWGVLTLVLVLSCDAGDVDPSPRPGAARPTGSDPGLVQRVETYLRPWIERGDFRGVVRIARGDEVLVDATWGLEHHVAGDPRDAPFRIASLTKTLTAGAVLMLADAGALSLEDPLDRFVSGVEAGERITVEDLLAHAAGVSPPDEGLYLRESLALDELVADIAARPLLFEPGSRSQYSNAGYNLLARVIEVATGRTYEAQLDHAIFQPLGMEDTGQSLQRPGSPVVPGLRPGPGASGVRPAPPIQFAAATGSGSLASTVEDLHRWGVAVAQNRLFSYEGRRWPFGWGRQEVAGQAGLEQTGAMTGATSSLSVFPSSGTVVVVLNAVEASDWTRWSRDLAALALGEEVEPVEIAQPVTTDVDGERLVGIYRSGETTLRIALGDGLELYRNDWPHGQYLMPLDDGTFLSRTTGGTVRFEPDVGEVRRLIQAWGDSGQTFERVAEAPAPHNP